MRPGQSAFFCAPRGDRVSHRAEFLCPWLFGTAEARTSNSPSTTQEPWRKATQEQQQLRPSLEPKLDMARDTRSTGTHQRHDGAACNSAARDRISFSPRTSTSHHPPAVAPRLATQLTAPTLPPSASPTSYAYCIMQYFRLSISDSILDPLSASLFIFMSLRSPPPSRATIVPS